MENQNKKYNSVKQPQTAPGEMAAVIEEKITEPSINKAHTVIERLIRLVPPPLTLRKPQESLSLAG